MVPALNELVVLQYVVFILPRKKQGQEVSPSLLTLEYTLDILFHFCCLTYIMERESCLVDPRAYEFVNPKLFNVVPYLILDPRKNEVNLKRFQNRVGVLYSVTNQSLFTILTGICRRISFLFFLFFGAAFRNQTKPAKLNH